MKKKILVVFGTRPEGIKMAPLVHGLKKMNNFECLVCVTAQHRQILDQVLAWFEIIPDYDLNIMRAGQDLYDVTTGVLQGLKEVLKEAQPDVVLVHGDTTTSFAAALAAFYQQIPVGHVEAGLRTHNLYAPFPEELNRQLTGRIARWHFSPTALNEQNLLQEGIVPAQVYVTGNTVIDALHWTSNKIKTQLDSFKKALPSSIRDIILDRQVKKILVTAHRRESFGNGFVNICKALSTFAEQHENVAIIYPVHPNPNVKEPVTKYLGNVKNIYLIDPLEYQYFVFLMEYCDIVLTDSGGVQEEAPSLGKPVLVMRDVTERREALTSGTVELVGTDFDKIIERLNYFLFSATADTIIANPYGDGKSVVRIAEILNAYFKQ